MGHAYYNVILQASNNIIISGSLLFVMINGIMTFASCVASSQLGGIRASLVVFLPVMKLPARTVLSCYNIAILQQMFFP